MNIRAHFDSFLKCIKANKLVLICNYYHTICIHLSRRSFVLKLIFLVWRFLANSYLTNLRCFVIIIITYFIFGLLKFIHTKLDWIHTGHTISCKKLVWTRAVILWFKNNNNKKKTGFRCRNFDNLMTLLGKWDELMQSQCI